MSVGRHALELKQPEQALREFEASLVIHRIDSRALWRARAAELSGDKRKRRLLRKDGDMTAHADSDRTGVQKQGISGTE